MKEEAVSRNARYRVPGPAPRAPCTTVGRWHGAWASLLPTEEGTPEETVPCHPVVC